MKSTFGMGSDRKHRGFTLMEVLVVISIIALLAAIIFFLFGESKRSAKGAQDISSLRQLGQARSIYMADVDGVDLRQVPPLVEANLVPKELLVSSNDPTPSGYANLFRESEGRPRLGYKLSFVTLRDVERTAHTTPIPSGAKRPGWLIAARHGRDLAADHLVPEFFEGKYLRLCDDGSVHAIPFFWHTVTVEGRPQQAVRTTYCFFDPADPE